MKIKQHIPNLVTLTNLWFGSLAALYAAYGHFEYTALFVALGIIADFLDGFLARKLKVSSPLGKQLDSLADLVTSGLVPGIVMFQLMTFRLGNPLDPERMGDWSMSGTYEGLMPYLAFSAFIITIAAGYRLAKFNIDERQDDAFIGLPTPAVAILIVSISVLYLHDQLGVLTILVNSIWGLIALILFCAWMMHAPVQLIALKFSSFGFKENASKYLFVLSILLLLLMFGWLAVPLIIIWYVLFSMLMNWIKI
ncbi:MAG: CDP-alcohol phosphatidyltransferase family protein [Flavobacteriaceae bacterium]|nr:CDP-alcohol phosphatidyltransferase family protein [Flavobacteriaceae bacterium]